MDIDREALNRTRKAALLAKIFIAAKGKPEMIEDPDLRMMTLVVARRAFGKTWTEASEQTWEQVKINVEVFG